MNTRDFIAKLGGLDVRVWVESDQLRVSAPQGALTPELKEELLERKAELMEALLSSGSAPIRRVESDQAIPLSCAQERIWVFDCLEPGNTTYNTEILLELAGELDRAALARSLAEVVRRHEPLRTTFQNGENGPLQRVSPPEPVDLRVIDLSTLASPECEEEERRAIKDEMNVPFQLDRDGLLRATLIQRSEQRQVLLLVTHHIVADGSALLVLARELIEFYSGFVRGDHVSLAELPIRFSDYARWQRDWLEGEGSRKLRAYWCERLAGELPVLELPTDRVRQPLQSYRGGSVTADIDSDTIARMRELAQEGGATLFTLLLAAFKAVLYRHCGQEDLIVGAAVQGRERVETRDLIGMFVNTVAIRTDLSGQPTFRELLGRVRESGQGALVHAELPFDQVVGMINPPRDRSRPPVFQALFNAFNEEAPEELLLPGLRVSAPDTDDLLSWLELESKFDLTVYSRESGSGLQLVLVYNADLFDHGRMERLLGHYHRLLQVVANDPDCRIGEIELLSEAERAAALPAPSPGEEDGAIGPGAAEASDVVSRFGEVASRWADRVAVKGMQSQWSYRELDQHSDRVAALVLETATTSNARIGVLCAPEPELLAALLGILKAGHSFVPLDPVNPSERLEQMVADAGIEVILADRANAALARQFEAIPVSLIEDIVASARAVPALPAARPDAEAYVLYTSGSTGTPKGVVQHYENLLRHVDGYARSIGICASDRVSLVSSYGFDAALVDIFGALLNGAVLIPMNLHQRGTHRLRDSLLEDEITVYHSTPTVFRSLMGFSSDDVFASIRTVVLGGESVRRSDIDAFREHFPRHALLVNLYGASESTTALQFIVDTDTELDQGSVPLGFAVDRTEAILLDEAGQPASVVGELAIKSGQVACGYLNQPELTEQVFLRVAGESDVTLYKTGDLARRRPDGALVFLGRKDHQVKLRGYRVEPGEIESVLEAHDAVSRAVIRLEGQGEYEQLVAFVSGPTDEDATIIQTLRQYLSERLPAYMVPARLEVLAEMPLTTTGKVDRTRLPEVLSGSISSDGATPPRDAIEQTLASIWSELLGLPALGVFDDFFELGGSSLQATQIVWRAEQVLEREVLLRDFFDDPTIAGMAQHLKQASLASTRPLIRRVESDQAIPLSYAQERIWVFDHLEPGNTTYNTKILLELEGELDRAALARSLAEVVRRHEPLRTTFQDGENGPIQRVSPPEPVDLRVIDLSTLASPEREEEERRAIKDEMHVPFQLDRDGLLRATLIQRSEQRQVLLLVTHHIVADGSSLLVLARELIEFYRGFVLEEGTSLAELPIRFSDYARWQRDWLEGEGSRQLRAYWCERLAGELPVLELPTDRVRLPVQSHRGGSVTADIDSDTIARIRELAQEGGVTVFTLLLAAFKAVLYRHCGQEDLIVGAAVQGRDRVETRDLIGMFVNTVAIRTDLSGQPSFRELLGRVRESGQGALAHAELPFDQVVEMINPPRDRSRPPVFQALFNAFNEEAPEELLLPGLRVSSPGTDDLLSWLELESKFDLTVYSRETGNGLQLVLVYNADLFDHGRMEALLGHYCRLLTVVVNDPDCRIGDIELLSEAERAAVLPLRSPGEAAGAIDHSRPEASAVVSRFGDAASRWADRVAVKGSQSQCSYRELDQHSDRVAALVLETAATPNARIGVLCAPEPELLAALLGILKACHSFVPLDPVNPSDRLEQMVADAGIEVILADRANAALAGQFEAIPVSFIEDIVASERAVPALPPARPDAEAYVLYTSGSTGTPKGVVQRYKNLLRHVDGYARSLGICESDRVSLVSSYGFDAALVDIFGALLNGAMLIPMDLHQRGTHRLRDRLLEEQITVYHSTPTVFRALIDFSTGDVFAAIRTVVLGGESVRRSDIDAFREHFPRHASLVNLYGASESTTALQFFVDADTELDQGSVPLGFAVGRTEAILLDEAGQPASVVGELAIKSGQVACGYLNQPELSEQVFLRVAGESDVTLYKTGDLARRRPDGALVFLGRKDHQVKLRGYRVEPGEIESVLEAHDAVSRAVIRLEGQGEYEQLVAFVSGPADEDATIIQTLRQYLSERLPAYMVPARLEVLVEMPLTTTGKVDRTRLPEVLSGSISSDGATPPRDAIEQTLASIWSEVLQRPALGVFDDFFELGGSSLQATQIVSRAERVLEREVLLRDFFADPTIAGMAQHLKTESASSLSRIEPKSVSRPDVIPLSYSQERMWFVQQLNPMNTAYNICVAMWLEGTLDESAMNRAFQTIVLRHESLRTKIRTTDGIPFQSVEEHPNFAIEWVDAVGASAEERKAEARKVATSLASTPFDLAVDWPLRVMVIRADVNSQLMVVVMHHAVSDRWSLGIMGAELVSLYNALQAGGTPSVPPLPVQYADYSVWQREWLQGERLESEMDYWRKQLDGIQPLSLPTDRPRHARLSLVGERIVTALPDELVSNINGTARRAGATSFMVLLAGFNALLSRYALSDDISLGVPIANRLHVDIEPLIGTFVNTLVLRNDLSGDPTFVELLDRVRGVALEAYGHQNLPFEKLVSELTSDRDMSRAPLVQVLFNVANAPVGRGGGLVGLVPEPDMLNNGGAQFDLTLSVRLEEPAFFMLNYNKELFERSTAQQISTHYLSLLEEALNRPEAHLSELNMLTAEERGRLLETWNATEMDYPRGSTYVSLFEQQVQRTPEHIAVECGDESLSYAMLNARAEAIADLLRVRAVGRGARVAILIERGLDMIVSLLGVMKSGAAYVPLDPAYPAARLDYVLEDSGAAVVLTETQYADMLSQSTGTIVCVDALGESDGEMRPDADEITSGAGPEDAAYVIYTSGSTGKPKGVVIPNEALVNFLFTMAQRPGLAQQDVLAAVTTVSFDIAGLELYLPLMLGGRVALLKKEETEDPYRLAECLERVGATVMQATPATWRMLLDIGWQGVPKLKALCGGEPLPLDLVNSLLPLVGELWNMYGPTETTIWSTIERVENAESPVLIGKPIGNTRIYILDRQGRPVPIGVPGEIHIAGDGVAIGYHQRPELTDERFVPDPFDERGGHRMYRTGDLGRFRRDGRIEHLGRIDHQVKIRGYRIELGEIESVLVSHPAVKECVCVVRGDRLVAYIVYEPDQDLMVTEVRRFLSEDLPAFMIPSIVVTVDVLPLTPNGKIDRNSLPDPFEQGSVAEREYVEPESETARMMAEIWAELLGVERVGTQDNFFDLGGHSLLAMQVVARVEQRSGNRIDPRSMFFQTLEQIVSDAELLVD